jgi:hypothetical protein
MKIPKDELKLVGTIFERATVQVRLEVFNDVAKECDCRTNTMACNNSKNLSEWNSCIPHACPYTGLGGYFPVVSALVQIV